jgi:predicted  nucleic acid-binding Zn-ribbon protein
VNVAFNHAIAKMEDETEIIEHHVFERIKKGCNECGNQDFGYNAGVKDENGLKWFVIQVHCDKCEARYEEIMEVRVTDEPNENDESE